MALRSELLATCKQTLFIPASLLPLVACGAPRDSLSDMPATLQIRAISATHVGLRFLRSEARAEGFAFLGRLVREWVNGTSRFGGSGEKLLGAFRGEQLIAVGGINRETYDPAPSRCRLRHLYVLKAFRRQGVATALLEHLFEAARWTFDEIHLRTESAHAAAFYERMGFQRSLLPTATHMRHLRRGACPP